MQTIHRITLAITILALTASAQSRLFTSGFNNEENLKALSDEQTFPQMPCATVAPQVYKLFSFYTLQAKTSYTAKIGLKEITFNMCTNPQSFPPECSPEAQYGYILEDSPTEVGKKICSPLFISGQDTFKFVVDADEEHDVNYVHFETQLNAKVHAKDNAVPSKFRLICDEKNSQKAPVVSFKTGTDGKQYLDVEFRISAACGEDAERYLILFENFRIFGIIFIVVSLPLIFFGLKFIKASLATVGAIFGIILTAFITSNFTNFMAFGVQQWSMFAAGAITAAVLTGLLCYFFTDVAVFFAGALLGYLGGKQLVYIYVGTTSNSLSDQVVGIVLGVCITIGFLLAVKLRKHIIILATSFGGAQLLAFGIGTVARNYPDYKIMVEQIKNKEFENVAVLNWVYIVTSLLVFVVGAHHQYRNYMNKAEEEEEMMGDYGKANGYDSSAGYY